MARQPLIQISAPAAAGFDVGSVAMPCPRAPVPDDQPAPDDQDAAQSPVCVVDDDDWVCDSLSAVLEAYGFAVRTFGSGMTFLADGRVAAARCLIIDQHMPGLDGLQVIAELRRRKVIVPTILITGRLDAAIVQRAIELGVVATLEKPFATARLIELVDTCCGPQQ